MLQATTSVGLLLLLLLLGRAAMAADRVDKRSIDLNAAAAHVDELALPRLVTVNGYHLELQPFMEEGTFKGRVRINVTCQEATSSITVHAHPSLRIESEPAEISVREIIGEDEVLSQKPILVNLTSWEPEKQWFMIALAANLTRTAMYQIDLRFEGDLVSENSNAFFRNSYTDKATEEKRWYAATKMSPTNARRVFPCFDEPMLKVPIELSVARPRGMVAMSVMPVRASENVTNEAGWVWDHFERTPSMSTFSFGVVVTDLPQLMSFNVPNTKGGVTIRVFGREEFKPELEKTVLLAPKLVDYMQKYLDLAFPLPELNLLALPNYSEDETADHWGLIVFKESNLMNGVGPWKLTYEIMDQWIGHLVTPHWWSDLRVANGLSNYLGVTSMLNAVCSDSWRPASSYSIYYEFSKPHPFVGIPTMRENIRVQSTQWLFRMLNYTLGEQTFRTGIQNFVRDRQMETFFEDDIWSALSEEGKLEHTLEDSIRVETITRTWMNQDRFPLVTVTRNYQKRTAHIEQRLFLRTRPHDVTDKSRLAWWVPLTMLTPDNLSIDDAKKPTQWMQAEPEMDIDNLPAPEEFIILNPDEIGMFMVNYDPHNWQLLADYLLAAGRKEVPALDVGVRTKLLHDAWNLAYSGDLSFATALNMTLFLREEREFPVWDVMYTMIDHVGRDIRHTEAGRKFQEYAQSLMIPMYESLGQEEKNESNSKTELRSMTKHFLCHANYKPCIDTAMEVYSVWMQMPDPESGNPVPDNELCLVFKWGTMEEWEFGLLRVINFPAHRKQQERSNMIRSLAGCPRQSEKVERFLNVTLLEGNGNFSENDVRLAINMLSGDAVGYTTLFDFLVKNWDAIKQRFESKPHMWEYVVSKAVGSFKTQEGLNRVSDLYAERKGQFLSAESIVIEKMKKAIEEAKWTSEALPVMNAWLDKKLETDKAMNGKVDK